MYVNFIKLDNLTKERNKNIRMASTVRVGNIKRVNKRQSRNRGMPILCLMFLIASKKPSHKTQTLFSNGSSKNGFFLTSVDDNNAKENQNTGNQQAEKVKQQEKEKPMFEDINRKSKIGNFNNNSKRL